MQRAGTVGLRLDGDHSGAERGENNSAVADIRADVED
jgi:hypothetical protein